MDPQRRFDERVPDAGGDPAAGRAALTGFLSLYAAGRYFDAHEALEVVWRRGPERRMVLLQGLIQLAVAFEHHRRGNSHGARVLLGRAWARLHDVSPGELGLDWADLLARHGELERAFGEWDRRGGAAPEVTAPVLRMAR